MLEFITDVPLQALPDLVEGIGLKRYTAGQVLQWIYQKGAVSFDEMTNLSKAARQKLSKDFDIDPLMEVGSQSAKDGTQKFLCKSKTDGEHVECVLIPGGEDRCTVCISTQVGCRMGCAFCRTGDMGFRRNLSQGEILSQLRIAMRSPGLSFPQKRESSRQNTGSPTKALGDDNLEQQRITNVVFMGMGEPLENYDAVANSIRVMCDESALGLSKKRITLSTSGLIPELRKFVDEFDIKIAISLNATTDEVRNRIMPLNKKYPLSEIMEFCREYSQDFKNRLTFEYVLMDGVNDSKEDARRLINLLKGVRAKINLIPFNPFEGSDLKAPKAETLEWWSRYLYDRGVQTNIRASRGQEILAACGQLATKSK